MQRKEASREFGPHIMSHNKPMNPHPWWAESTAYLGQVSDLKDVAAAAPPMEALSLLRHVHILVRQRGGAAVGHPGRRRARQRTGFGFRKNTNLYKCLQVKNRPQT